ELGIILETLLYGSVRGNPVRAALVEYPSEGEHSQQTVAEPAFPGGLNTAEELFQEQDHGQKRKEADENADAVVSADPRTDEDAEDRAKPSHGRQQHGKEIEEGQAILHLGFPARSFA